MKRKVPVFRVNAKPGASYDVLAKAPGLKQIVIEELKNLVNK